MSLVISSIGVKMLIIFVEVSSCEGFSTEMLPSIPYAASAIFWSITDSDIYSEEFHCAGSSCLEMVLWKS